MLHYSGDITDISCIALCCSTLISSVRRSVEWRIRYPFSETGSKKMQVSIIEIKSWISYLKVILAGTCCMAEMLHSSVTVSIIHTSTSIKYPIRRLRIIPFNCCELHIRYKSHIFSGDCASKSPRQDIYLTSACVFRGRTRVSNINNGL